ncbi:acyl-CoA dehydrogenase family protein [Desulfotruncus alcoholivorax]|uniref:acyl-CoA dehydrogenase family protein n=1 Tax=Desulfotruncus alcoholivorax TaxID=265477 RepID=UPI0003FA3913|nr:acyl-CoA dehydrogenase family protein [Desulfotruncus alcoholivorax]
MADFNLSPEQEQLLEEFRDIALHKIAPMAAELDEAGDGRFDFGPVRVLAEHNFLTPTIPCEYGGRGLDYFTTSLLLEELAAACAGVATVVTANIHAASPIVLAGTGQQKKTYLPLLASRKAHLAALALTEPEAGSDIASISTLAVKNNGFWNISGTKEFVINGGVASFTTLFATTGPDKKRSGMIAFVLPAGIPGLKEGAVRHKLGIRYVRTTQLVLDRVHVPDEMVIGSQGSAYLLLMQTFDRGRALAGAVGVGLARAAYEFALEFSKKRHQFGRPVFDQQAVAFNLADLLVKIEAARLLVWKACWLIDNDLDYTMLSSMAKLAGSSVAQEAAAAAMDICGGRGYLKGCPVEKYLRDARVMSLIEGTNNIQKAVIASQL